MLGVSKVGLLKENTGALNQPNGGNPSSALRSPGRTKFDAITLERGVTQDIEFEQWAGQVCNSRGGIGAEVSINKYSAAPAQRVNRVEVLCVLGASQTLQSHLSNAERTDILATRALQNALVAGSVASHQGGCHACSLWVACSGSAALRWGT